MKHFSKITISLLASLALLVGVNLSPLLAHAAGASIYLRANKTEVSSGGSLIVAVYMNGGGNPINAVEADLNYPASKLQYVGLSYSGGAFSINTPSNGGGSGTVSIQNGTVTPISGTGLIATVTFKALVGSGSASIGISGSSNLISANTNASVAYSTEGLSVTFGVVAAGPAATNESATPATPAAPKDTTPPIISNIKVQNLTPFSATITWTTNEAADSNVEYGLDATYGLSNSSSALTTTHSVALSSSFLTPETVFHYHVKSADAAGNVATSPDQTLNLPGVPVTVVVMGPDGKPQAGAQVTLDGATATTDSKGSATLSSGLGNKKITTTYQGVTIQKPITVSKTAKPLPPYQLDLAKQPLNHWMLTSIGLVVIVLTLLGIDAMLFGSRIFARLVGIHFIPKDLHLAHHHSAPATSTGTTAMSPRTTPVTDKPSTGALVDPSKTIAELMGPEAIPESPAKPVSQASPARPAPISHFTSDITPPQTVAPAPAAPSVTRISVAEAVEPESPAANVSKRLKKKPAKTTVKTKKKKS